MPIGDGLEMSDLYQATIIMSLIFIIFFSIPLTYLIVQQTQNFLLNQTTNMRFSKHRREDQGNNKIDFKVMPSGYSSNTTHEESGT
jgi:hypothetical protein